MTRTNININIYTHIKIRINTTINTSKRDSTFYLSLLLLLPSASQPPVSTLEPKLWDLLFWNLSPPLWPLNTSIPRLGLEIKLEPVLNINIRIIYVEVQGMNESSTGVNARRQENYWLAIVPRRAQIVRIVINSYLPTLRVSILTVSDYYLCGRLSIVRAPRITESHCSESVDMYIGSDSVTLGAHGFPREQSAMGSEI